MADDLMRAREIAAAIGQARAREFIAREVPVIVALRRHERVQAIAAACDRFGIRRRRAFAPLAEALVAGLEEASAHIDLTARDHRDAFDSGVIAYDDVIEAELAGAVRAAIPVGPDIAGRAGSLADAMAPRRPRRTGASSRQSRRRL
jgi:hypothetical protein